MDTPVQPVPTLIPPSLKEALASIFIGIIIAIGTYGMSIVQAYNYFRHNSQDHSPHMKCFVALLFAVDTVSLVLAVCAGYDFVVSDFGDPLSLLQVPTSMAFENGTSTLTRGLAQCFFAHRIWALSRRNIALVGSIVFLSLASLGPGMVLSVFLYTDRDIFSLGSNKTRILVGFCNGSSVLCDIAIVSALCYYLNLRRTGFRRTEFMIDHLIIYAVNRGVLTTVCQACEMITNIALPGRFLFIPFSFLGGRLYCCTLLATLNAQTSMREDGINVVELDTHVLDRVRTSKIAQRNPKDKARSPVVRLEDEAGERMSTFVLDISGDHGIESQVADAEASIGHEAADYSASLSHSDPLHPRTMQEIKRYTLA